MSPTGTSAREGALRIGEVAELAGTTPRTVRYYEELGLLPHTDRVRGQHRLYSPRDVERLQELLRIKSLLGVSLDELKELIDAEEARALLRDEYRRGPSVDRRRQIVTEALGHLERQLELVRRRSRQLAELEAELAGKHARLRLRLAELDRKPASDTAQPERAAAT
jgi:DNA-binding transcriptional MerR regulator